MFSDPLSARNGIDSQELVTRRYSSHGRQPSPCARGHVLAPLRGGISTSLLPPPSGGAAAAGPRRRQREHLAVPFLIGGLEFFEYSRLAGLQVRLLAGIPF